LTGITMVKGRGQELRENPEGQGVALVSNGPGHNLWIEGEGDFPGVCPKDCVVMAGGLQPTGPELRWVPPGRSFQVHPGATGDPPTPELRA